MRENREPIVDTTVTFTVLSGLNAGKTGTAGRIESGQATFTYTDTGGPGTDPIQAHYFEDSESKKESNVVTVPWGTAAATPPTRPRASASRTRTRRIRCRLGRA